MIEVIKKSRTKLQWAIDSGLVWFWVVFTPLLVFFPADYWYHISSIVVTDQKTEDGDRILDIDRRINNGFYGAWRVEEQKRMPDGKFTTVQTCTGTNYYRTDKTMPDPVTLSWWKGDNCKYSPPFTTLSPGAYRLCTFVEIQPALIPNKVVQNCSPVFFR
jgi:hypothetical protein